MIIDLHVSIDNYLQVIYSLHFRFTNLKITYNLQVAGNPKTKADYENC